jgi:hypothetical protein
MKRVLAVLVALMVPAYALSQEKLDPVEQPIAERVEEAVKPAKDAYLKLVKSAQDTYKKVLESEQRKATSRGSLEDVKALQKEMEAFAADETQWKSPAHKAAIKRYLYAIDTAKKRYVARLDTLIKEQVRKKNLDVAEGINGIKQECASGLPRLAASSRSGWIDLMPLIDPGKDAVVGKWEKKNGELLSGMASRGRIGIPYIPPDEYDVEVQYTRLGNDSNAIILYKPGASQFVLGIGWHGRHMGFAMINGKSVDGNSTTKAIALTKNKTYACRVEVRDTYVRAYMDGKLMIEHKTDYRDFGMHHYWEIGSKNTLGLFDNVSPTRYHKIMLREVKGRGRPLR